MKVTTNFSLPILTGHMKMDEENPHKLPAYNEHGL